MRSYAGRRSHHHLVHAHRHDRKREPRQMRLSLALDAIRPAVMLEASLTMLMFEESNGRISRSDARDR